VCLGSLADGCKPATACALGGRPDADRGGAEARTTPEGEAGARGGAGRRAQIGPVACVSSLLPGSVGAVEHCSLAARVRTCCSLDAGLKRLGA
jgi:hypothetical protein